MTAIRYVLGFAFDHDGRVVLIRKNRPDWQKGRWNGIGGHIEAQESEEDAMVREFKEETGIEIPSACWIQVGSMFCDIRWQCTIFTTTHGHAAFARRNTDEYVKLWTPGELAARKHDLIENLPVLIAACLMPADHTGKVPRIRLNYS